MTNQQNSQLILLAAVLLAVWTCPVVGQQLPDAPAAGAEDQQQQPRNVLNEHLFPPELILQNAAKIGLLNAQRQSIEAEVSRFQSELPQQQQQLQAQLDALGTTLDDASAEESAILTQVDNVLKSEAMLKRLQLRMLVRVRSQLTVQQRQSMQDIKTQLVADQQELQKRLQAKVMRVQQLAQQLAAQGTPPNEALQLMQTFQQQIQQGNVAQAEATLDRALQMLQAPQQ